MAELILTSGPRKGERIALENELVLGREGVDLVIDDPELSRRHVVLRPLAGGVEVEDLGSKNGTFVDGARITGPVILSPGAKLELGATAVEIVVETAQETRPSAIPPPRAAETVARDIPVAATAAATRESTAVPTPAPAPSPAPSPAPAPAAPTPAPPSPAVDVPAFGGYAASGPGRGGRAAATRLPLGTALTVAVIVADAVALLVYFAGR